VFQGFGYSGEVTIHVPTCEDCMGKNVSAGLKTWRTVLTVAGIILGFIFLISFLMRVRTEMILVGFSLFIGLPLAAYLGMSAYMKSASRKAARRGHTLDCDPIVKASLEQITFTNRAFAHLCNRMSGR
jgi:hypothetical protein